MDWHYGFRPYVPVAQRRARAMKKLEKLRRKGVTVSPVEVRGRAIASTFWGKAWCNHLEKFSDYENRLPRGRSYVRNGSVCHIEIAGGAVRAMVIGTDVYNVEVTISRLPTRKWRRIKARCEGHIGSLLELLQGRLSGEVMAVVTDRDHGLFPLPREIGLRCDCPDWAVMCKHVAAVLYAVGARLDENPELLFLLRGVDHEELIGSEAAVIASATAGKGGGRRRIAEGDVERIFGIEMVREEPAPASAEKGRARPKEASTRPIAKKGRIQKRPGRKPKIPAVARSGSGRGTAGTQNFTGSKVRKALGKSGL